ncbi:MAG: HAD-IIA family hydrolase [Ruminococcaceae bacterium]|nr:HAD-IIA family hydrolase [Oscillospiraceae bacterium]
MLKSKKLFLLDMDGTLYLDNDLFDGTTEFLEYIKSSGGKYLFLTNNSSKSVNKYVEKMANLGIETTENDFLTSSQATSLYLKKKKYKKIYVFGTDSLKEELGCFNITDKLEDEIDCLVMGFDTQLTFQKLEDACILLGRGVDYIATNPDYVCPTSYGYVPDCGSVSDMLYNATKRRPLFIGKPKPEMALLAMEKTGYSKAETVIIGDRIYTDIACGLNAGIDSIMVLSGESTRQDIEKYKINPTFVLDDIRDVLSVMKE